MERLAARIYVALVLALLAVTALSLVHGDFLQAAVALLTLLADFAGLRSLVVGIVLCLLAGAAPAALIASAILATKLAGRWGMRLSSRQRANNFSLDALAGATAFPAPLRDRLARFAQSGAITTRTMLAAASDAEPARWRRALGHDPGNAAFDGPLLIGADGSECSQYAAEALGLAHVLGERLRRPLDVELLGASAALIPLAAAGEWLDDDCSKEDLVRATISQLTSALEAYASTAPGADLLRRVEEVG